MKYVKIALKPCCLICGWSKYCFDNQLTYETMMNDIPTLYCDHQMVCKLYIQSKDDTIEEIVEKEKELADNGK